MDRRTFIKQAGGAAAGVLGATSVGAAGRSAPGILSGKRPNIIYVFADQLRTQACGYHGGYADYPDAYTPNIDRLAAESTDFRQAVSSTPVCCPYRNSLFTGKFQSSTGMVKNELQCMPDHDSVGRVLHWNGYRTSYIGKWHMNNQQYVPPGPLRLGFDQEWRGYNFNHNYYDGYYYRDTPERHDVEGYEPDVQTDLALDFLQRASKEDDPFALFLSWGPPHKPWHWGNVPDAYADRFRGKAFPDPPNYRDGHGLYWVPSWDEQWWMNSYRPKRERIRQVYYAQTSNLDWNLGRLLAAVDELGLAEDTVFVFTSDHGEMFGSQGRLQKNIFYEEAARVPFLLRWPGQVKEQAVDTCLNTPDIMPTLLALLDLEIPSSVEGVDLSHVARGEGGPEPDYALMQGMGHAYRWEDGWEWRAIRDERHTYAVMLGDGREMLFDNVSDPFQTQNLLDELHRPEVQEAYYFLQDRMYEELFALRDPMWSTTEYRGRWTDGSVIVRSATRGQGTATVPPLDDTGLSLAQNYPNPFRGQTTIRFTVERPTLVELSLYDVMGRHVHRLRRRRHASGTHEVRWDGTADDGRRLAAGTYLCRLSTPGAAPLTRRMSFLG